MLSSIEFVDFKPKKKRVAVALGDKKKSILVAVPAIKKSVSVAVLDKNKNTTAIVPYSPPNLWRTPAVGYAFFIIDLYSKLTILIDFHFLFRELTLKAMLLIYLLCFVTNVLSYLQAISCYYIINFFLDFCYL